MGAPASTELVSIPFHEDELQAAQSADGRIRVGIRRICDAFAIDFSSQLKKLKAAPWATVEDITTVDARGATRSCSVIDLQVLPMWLATIHSGKLAATLRPKLVAYQREAAKVLADHFLTKPAPPTPSVPAVPMFNPEGGSLLQFTAAMIVQMQTLHQVVADQEAARRQLATIEARTQAIEAKADAVMATVHQDPAFMSLMGFCNDQGLRLCVADLAKAGKAISAYCRNKGIEIRSAKSEIYGRVNIYRMDALEAWLRSRG